MVYRRVLLRKICKRWPGEETADFDDGKEVKLAVTFLLQDYLVLLDGLIMGIGRREI